MANGANYVGGEPGDAIAGRWSLYIILQLRRCHSTSASTRGETKALRLVNVDVEQCDADADASPLVDIDAERHRCRMTMEEEEEGERRWEVRLKDKRKRTRTIVALHRPASALLPLCICAEQPRSPFICASTSEGCTDRRPP